MRKLVDLNCDMGEGYGHWSLSEAPDEDLMALISSANIAAGFHAGDPNSIDRVVRLARAHGVGMGAHPGYRDLQGFGRRFIDMSPDELINDILYQVGAVREFGRRHGIPLQHVKPHGALYMELARHESLSWKLVETLAETSAGTLLFCMDISQTYQVARQAGLPVVREFYADRDYSEDGAIVFRRSVTRPDPQQVAEKCLRACQTGEVVTDTGKTIRIDFESICFHSDTPGAVAIGRAIRDTLTGAGITIAPAATVLQQSA